MESGITSLRSVKQEFLKRPQEERQERKTQILDILRIPGEELKTEFLRFML
ncbi:MAG: hypothetical protein WCR55_14670 [Lentisphaerota bacterium]